MKIKTQYLSGLMFISSFFGAQQAKASNISDVKKNTVEIKTDSLSQKQIQDTISLTDAINPDTLLQAQKEAKIKAAEELMLYTIANFEGFKSVPYRLPGESFLTYNIGNTKTPEGNAVAKTDTITSSEQAKEVFSAHLHKVSPMVSDMIQYLPIDVMSDAEIAVMASLLYNCGSGILYNKNKESSELTDLANKYFTTHTPQAQKEFLNKFKQYNKVTRTIRYKNGKTKKVKLVHDGLTKRRTIEAMIITGEIQITTNENIFTNFENNVINLKTSQLGILNNIKTIRAVLNDPEKYACTDSLNQAIQKDIASARNHQQKPRRLNLAQIRKQNQR